MERINEYFPNNNITIPQISISCTPPNLLKQERDWTCSLACIRTILSAITKNIPSEDELIAEYSLTPGPYFSKDIKDKGILNRYKIETFYGCDKTDLNIQSIVSLLQDGYYVMVESMYNYSHWMVFIGYYCIKNRSNMEYHKVLLYDPYYDNIRLENSDEFLGMWHDGASIENHIERDIVAIRAK